MKNIEEKRAEDHTWLTDSSRELNELIQAWDYYIEMQIFTKHLIESKVARDGKS